MRSVFSAQTRWHCQKTVSNREERGSQISPTRIERDQCLLLLTEVVAALLVELLHCIALDW